MLPNYILARFKHCHTQGKGQKNGRTSLRFTNVNSPAVMSSTNSPHPPVLKSMQNYQHAELTLYMMGCAQSMLLDLRFS